MNLRTQQYDLLSNLDLGEVVSYAIVWGSVPALTSDLAYPMILFPELLGLGRAC